MEPFMTARLFAALVFALLATSRPLIAQSTVRYTVEMTEGSGRPSRAVVTTTGDRSRIQPIRTSDDREDSGTSGYIVVRDGNLYSIDPDKRAYDVMSSEEFEQIVGTALRSVSPIVKMHVDDVSVSTEEIHDAKAILGFPTRHFRFTQKYSMRVTAFGMNGDDESTENEVVTDFWFAATAKLPRNPLIELMLSAATAPAQQNRDFVRESARVRDSQFTGMPLLAIVRGRERGEGALREKARVEVTQVERVTADSSLFSVPTGFTRTNGKGMRFSL
jgi:hypothetical protein